MGLRDRECFAEGGLAGDQGGDGCSEVFGVGARCLGFGVLADWSSGRRRITGKDNEQIARVCSGAIGRGP
jgi:hypothetical protein